MERYSTKMKEQQQQHNSSIASLQGEIEKRKKANVSWTYNLLVVSNYFIRKKWQWN